MDVRLVEIDQQVPVALGALQQTLELLDEGLPPLRISSPEQLLGLLSRQLEAVQGGADGLPAAQAPEALPHMSDQAPEGPARRRVGSFYRRSGRCLLRCAHRLAEADLDPGAKGGRPPVRRKARASGPRALLGSPPPMTEGARRPVRTATWVALPP